MSVSDKDLHKFVSNYVFRVDKTFAGKTSTGYFGAVCRGSKKIATVVNEGDGSSLKFTAVPGSLGIQEYDDFCKQAYELCYPGENGDPRELGIRVMITARDAVVKAAKHQERTYGISLEPGKGPMEVFLDMPNGVDGEAFGLLKQSNAVVVSRELSARDFRDQMKLKAMRQQKSAMAEGRIVVLTVDNKIKTTPPNPGLRGEAQVKAAGYLKGNNPGSYVPLADKRFKH